MSNSKAVMNNSIALIPVFTRTINSQAVHLCDARTLHAFMGVLRDFSNWIKGRIRKFGFVEGMDYLLAKSGEQVPHQGGTRTVERIDYHLTLDMAKELAMVENNPKGREARRYFIACEKAAHITAAPQPQAMDVRTLCQLILGGIFTGQDFIKLAYAVNHRQFVTACNNQNRGYGEEVASKISDLSWADLHIINQKASMEVWMRSEIPAKAA